jgi:outer membrane protein assembly factor BamB
MIRKNIAILGLLFGLPALVAAGDWPQFRGPDGLGLADKPLPTEWAADKNIKWKVAVPGVAWSSPIIVGDKVIVTTAITEKQTKPKPFAFPGGGPGGGRPGGPGGGAPGGPPPGGRPGGPGGPGGMYGNQKPPDVLYQWEVHCLDRATGKTLWKQTALEAKPKIPALMGNTFASETPVTDGERVYAYFGMHGLFCFDLDGKLVWKQDLGAFPMLMGWGTGSSPALEGDHLFVQCDNEEKSFLVALDKKTGKELWRVSRDEQSSWCTPFVWRNKVRTELVTAAGKKVRSYDPATSKVLWELSMNGPEGAAAGPGPGGPGGFRMPPTCSASPVANDELLYVGTGGPMSSSPLFAVKAGASGDITPKKGETTSAGVAWSRTQAGPSMASPLLYQGCIYIVEQRGGLISCYDAKTGEPAYKKERLPNGKGFTSSPWAADGKVYCLDEDGTTFVVQAGKEFKVLGQNKLGEMFWSSAAAAEGDLLLRGVDNLYCIGR